MRFGVAFVFWVLALALTSAGLHWILVAGARLAGFAELPALWAYIDAHWPVSSIFVRLIGFGSLQLLVIRMLLREVRAQGGRLHRIWRALVTAVGEWFVATPARNRAGLVLVGSVTLAVFVPFVLQPTLVPLEFGVRAWAERAANLTDGTAAWAVHESMGGSYHRTFDPAPALGPPESDGRLDRWDPLLREVAGARPGDFALLKAVMAIESGGRQFAVSPTGCAGLMQFCVGTARAPRFARYFSRTRVFPCRRRPVPKATAAALESGDAARIRAAAERFPCALSDHRFDPGRSLGAGWAYLSDLRQQVGSPDLVYIGYNSGPSVARALAAKLGRAPSPRQLRAHLTGALRPHYGAAARAPRAASAPAERDPCLDNCARRVLRL